MTEKPILFSGPMVRAILDGRKTMTRRVIKVQPPVEATSAGNYSSSREGVTNRWTWMSGNPKDCDTWEPLDDFKLPYAPGDLLWVREAHAIVGNVDPGFVLYRANGYEAECERHGFDKPYPPEAAARWRPSIFMPRWASRITLRVTAVKVERLQDISEDDARAEGISPLPSGRYYCDHDEDGEITAKSPVTAFAWLWNSIHGEDAWMANPWIAAYSFERVTP